jgi:hypothetical protein
MEWIVIAILGTVVTWRLVTPRAAKPRPRWKVEQEKWLRDEGYFGGTDAEERDAYNARAKGLDAFNNPQETWKDFDGNVRSDW